MDNKKYYTIFNYKMAKYLLRNGCIIADIGLNRKMKGIVFHFVNDEKLQKLIALKKDIIKLQKETKAISQGEQTQEKNDISKQETFKKNTLKEYTAVIDSSTLVEVESTKPTIE